MMLTTMMTMIHVTVTDYDDRITNYDGKIDDNYDDVNETYQNK
jgi:hypothetical protein